MERDITEELHEAKHKMLEKVRQSIIDSKSKTNMASGNPQIQIINEESSDSNVVDEIVPLEPEKITIIQEIVNDNNEVVDTLEESPKVTKTECSHTYKHKGETKKCTKPVIGDDKYCAKHMEAHIDEPDIRQKQLMTTQLALYQLENLTFMTMDKVFTAYDLHKNETMAKEFREQKDAFEEVNTRIIDHYGDVELLQKLTNPLVTLALMMTGVVGTHMAVEKKLLEDKLK